MLVFLHFQSADIEPSLAPFAKWDVCESGGQYTVFLYSCNANSLSVESYVEGTHGFDYKEIDADCAPQLLRKRIYRTCPVTRLRLSFAGRDGRDDDLESQ